MAGVTNPASGQFCIALAAGIDATQTGLVATPDFSVGDTVYSTDGSQTIVEWYADAVDCPAGQLELRTGYRHVTHSGSTDGDVRAVTNTPSNEPFFFVVP